jgi:arylsulfatase A-like enzyme
MPAILSGAYQWSYSGEVYEKNRPHLASILRDAGYSTAGFHSNPFLDARYGWDRGFDTYGSESEIDDGLRERIRRLALEYETTKQLGRKIMRFVGQRTGTDIRGDSHPYLPASTLHEQASSWLETQSEPVFLWLHYMDAHNPWTPREGTDSMGLDETELTRIFYSAREDPTSVTDAQRNKLRRAYRGEITHFDRRLGSFLDELDRQLGDTVICLTSDHGELFGEHDSYFHPGELYTELLRVPFIVSPRSGLAETAEPISTVDILPTLCGIAGCEPPAVDGADLRNEPGCREVFAAVNDTLRVISADRSDEYSLDSVPNDALTDSIRKQIASLSGSDISIDQFDDEDLQDQLEALGYK